MNNQEREQALRDRSTIVDPRAIATKMDVSENFGKIGVPARIMIAGPTLAGELS